MDYRYNIRDFVLELDVSMSSAADLFGEYLKETGQNIREAKELLLSGDFRMLERVMHNIKGISANLEITDVFEAAREFDDRLKNNITGEAAQYMQRLEEVYLGAEKEIKRFFSDQGLHL